GHAAHGAVLAAEVARRASAGAPDSEVAVQRARAGRDRPYRVGRALGDAAHRSFLGRRDGPADAEDRLDVPFGRVVMFTTRDRLQLFLQSDPDLWAVILKSKEFTLTA